MTVRNLQRHTFDGREWFGFHFGHGNDFSEALDSLKADIEPTQRQYQPTENNRWYVLATEDNTETLNDIFDNFSEALGSWDSQGALF